MTLLPDLPSRSATATDVSRRHLSLAYDSVGYVLASFDAACIVTLSVVCGAVHDIAVFGRVEDVNRYLGIGIAVAALFLPLAHARRLYLTPRLFRSGFPITELLRVWTLVFLCLAAVGVVLQMEKELAPGAFLLFFLVGIVGIGVLRWAAKCAFTSLSGSGSLAKRQAVLIAEAGSPVAANLMQDIEESACTVFRTILLPKSPNEDGFAAIMDDVVDSVRRRPVDEILLATNWTDPALIETIAGHLQVVPVPVKLVPDPLAQALLKRPLVDLGGITAIELQRVPLTRLQLTMKRFLDLMLGVLALPFLTPVLAMIAAAIALDSPGPVFFRQRRVGFNGRTFQIYKFRTMTTLEDGAVIRQASEGDDRITRIGRVLRRFSLDELPQIFNVLKGDMSFVGPRPHALAHDDEYGRAIAAYAARHNVKPGITGWAQVNGWRGGTPELYMMARRIDHDLWYVRHWSIWLDIRILALTAFSVCRAQNAY